MENPIRYEFANLPVPRLVRAACLIRNGVAVGELDTGAFGEAFPCYGEATFSNEDTEKVVALWRNLPAAEQMRCHIPGFGLVFEFDSPPPLVAAICWSCNNISMKQDRTNYWSTFDGRSLTARQLLELCSSHFGIKVSNDQV